MKEILRTFHKWILGVGFSLLLLVLVVAQAEGISAHPAQSAGQQSVFSRASQTAAEGRATIQSQEIRLDSPYFSNNGTLVDLEVTPAGLVLAADKSRGSYISGIIKSPLAFSTDIVPLWQVDLPQGTEFVLETRLSIEGQGWSEWLVNPEAFYPVRNNLHGGHLIWASNKEVALQVRVTLQRQVAGAKPTLNNLTLVFNDTSAGPTDGQIARRMAEQQEVGLATTDVCPAQPGIISRTEWGCPEGQDSPRRSPLYQPITHIIIHQAETPNHILPYQTWSGWVRSIWNYHANVLGWGDVGYNYLIDPAGNIYEGRAGGDDVVGIHDTYNYGSLAIGFLGCYGDCDDPRLSEADPSEVMLTSASQLMAWKLGQKSIDPLSIGPYGYWGDIPVIAGGRDVTWTTSPGGRLYDKLSQLRQEADAKIEQCSVALTECRIANVFLDQIEYHTGDSIQLTTYVVDQDDEALSGASVTYTVEITPAVQSMAFNLNETPGHYQGIYTDTQVAGEYLFNITASDPTGERFLPCYAPKTVVVNNPTSTPSPTPGTPTATATLTETPTTTTPTATSTPSATVTPSPTLTETTATTTPTATSTPSATISPSPTLTETPATVTPTATSTPSATISPSPTLTETPVTTTPTTTSTPSATVSPTVTVTATPTGPIVKIEPQQVILSSCNAESVAVILKNVTGVAGVDLEVSYNPAVVQVVDADSSQAGVQVNVDNIFATSFVVKNKVITETGRIAFVATLIGQTIEGDNQIIFMDWEQQGAGTGAVTLENVKLSDAEGQSVGFTLQNGAIEVISNCQVMVGKVTLQGRNNYAGIRVNNKGGEQTQTTIDGSFYLTGNGVVDFEFPGYLSAQVDTQRQTMQVSNGGPINLGTITLLAGDINNDNLIDILDLAYIANHYGSNNPTSDLNADGIVDILDLALAANNYGQQGRLDN